MKIFAPLWAKEQELTAAIESGDPGQCRNIVFSEFLADGGKNDAEDWIRRAKDYAVVYLSVCAGSGIRAGCYPPAVYDLRDRYLKRVESCSMVTELNWVCGDFAEEMAGMVHEEQLLDGLSSPVQQACRYMDAHPEEPVSIGKLAEDAGYTEYYFSAKFKKETGKSVSDYLLERRIARAKILLATTDESIASISSRFCFSSRSHFSSRFTEMVSMSPSEYRRRHRIGPRKNSGKD